MHSRLERKVSTGNELQVALEENDAISVAGVIADLQSIRLRPGQALRGVADDSELRFASGQHGIQISVGNAVADLAVTTDVDRKAIYNDTTVSSLGNVVLNHLTLTGSLRILARDAVRGGHVEAHCVHIEAADARGFKERPAGYGVEVVPGAFTVWNQQADPEVMITADFVCISAGRAGAPVRGSGIFVSGAGDVGGKLIARRCETGAVYSDGGIAAGTSDRISGGVFIVYGAHVAHVRNEGPVTTYGSNDMVLDNWGAVDRWTAKEAVTSYGSSGIGFVNFGTINVLKLHAPIETFGQGARGYNVYAGSVETAEFDRIVTHADGAVGLQVSQPVGSITVRRGIETFGGHGESLVKGVMMQLPATALSVKPGGSVRRVDVHGGLATHGKGVDPLELHGTIGVLCVHDGFGALGAGFATL